MRSNMRVSCAIAMMTLVLGLAPAGGQPPERAVKDHEFGDIILYVVTSPRDSKGDSGYGLYEKAKVTQLGDRLFIVGTVPSLGEGELEKAAAGKVVWTPLSEVVQLTEFKTIADAKKYFEQGGRQGEKGDR